ncbi:MAG: ankyrin repeat domain-containing protein [Hellea sp.]
MELQFEAGRLFARFSFHVVDDTTDVTIANLSDYVYGQMTDGFGEGKYYLPSRYFSLGVKTISFISKDKIAAKRIKDEVIVRPPSPSKRLLWAAEDGDLEYINLAVSNGQKLDVKGKWKMTPLSMAVQRKHTECVRALLEGGARLDLPLYDHVDSTGPIQQNSMTGTYLLDWSIAKDLPEDAQVIFEDERALEIARILSRHDADFNRQLSGNYDRPIQWAIGRDSWALVEFYLENGADPNYRHDYLDRTLLMEFPKVEAANLLIRYGLDLSHKSKDGQTTREFIAEKIRKLDSRSSEKVKLETIISIIDKFKERPDVHSDDLR